jgi:hypothetical protein
MATPVKFHAFPEHVAEGVHNLATGQMVIALTNTAPTASTNTTISDITQISYTNASSRNVTTTSSSQTSGTYSLVLVDLVITASGAVGPFRYAVLYNDTPTSPADPLIQYYDYGSSITLANGETFTVDFGATALTLA